MRQLLSPRKAAQVASNKIIEWRLIYYAMAITSIVWGFLMFALLRSLAQRSIEAWVNLGEVALISAVCARLYRKFRITGYTHAECIHRLCILSASVFIPWLGIGAGLVLLGAALHTILPPNFPIFFNALGVIMLLGVLSHFWWLGSYIEEQNRPQNDE